MNPTMPPVDQPPGLHGSRPGAQPVRDARGGERPHLVFPREHGAWGMVSLPLIAGALMGGSGTGAWSGGAVLVAAVAVFSVFLLRPPLLVLLRSRAATKQTYGPAYEQRLRDVRDAWFSVATYGLCAAATGTFLLLNRPAKIVIALAAGAAVMGAVVLYLELRNFRRFPALQIASATGLTASSLVGFLGAAGGLGPAAFWIWTLSAAHSTVSILVVHARLEWLVAGRKSPPPTEFPNRRNAFVAQGLLGLLLVVLGVQGKPLLALPFLPPFVLHVWDLHQMCAGHPCRLSMQRVGFLQLGASIAFTALLIAVLRISS